MGRKRKSLGWVMLLVASIILGLVLVIALVDHLQRSDSFRVGISPHLSLAAWETPKATFAQYQRIRIGMAEAELLRLMGGPGEEVMGWDFGKGEGQIFSGSFKTLAWRNSETSGLFVAIAEGRVVSKSQVGLR